ncbi:hypothetical protein HMI55_005906 [Coelomomyces lativittatus]|nr:hypothetical protein HMI55_005906 [Coelomomyces lativittatus]
MTPERKWPPPVFNSVNLTCTKWTSLKNLKYPWHEEPISYEVIIFKESSLALEQEKELTLSALWSNLKIRQCFRTLERLKQFLLSETRVSWEDQGHSDYLIEMGELDGGVIHLKFDAEKLPNNSKKKKRNLYAMSDSFS